MNISLIKNRKLLFLTNTNQIKSKFAKYKNLPLKGSYDRDKNWYYPLSKIFKNVIRYDYQKRIISSGFIETQKEIINLVKLKKPDYVLVPMSMYEIDWRTFQKIRELGAKVVLNFSDDAVRFEDYGKWWFGYFDYCLTEDKDAQIKYEKLGAKSLHVICGASKNIYKKIRIDKEYQVSFVGAKISDRENYINEIKDKGINVKTFGNGWNSYISNDQMIQVYNSSKINLNFTGCYNNAKIKQIKARIFEITMCGGFLLTEYAEGLEKYFEIGKEIDCFRTKEEAVEKILYYLRNDDIRNKIAAAGWKRAQNDHSWEKRLYEIFNKIELNIRAEQSSFLNTSSENINFSKQIKRSVSSFHYNWAMARLLEGQISFFKEEIKLSLSYNHIKKKALGMFVLSHLSMLLKPKEIISLYNYVISFYRFLKRVAKLPYKLIKFKFK